MSAIAIEDRKVMRNEAAIDLLLTAIRVIRQRGKAAQIVNLDVQPGVHAWTDGVICAIHNPQIHPDTTFAYYGVVSDRERSWIAGVVFSEQDRLISPVLLLAPALRQQMLPDQVGWIIAKSGRPIRLYTLDVIYLENGVFSDWFPTWDPLGFVKRVQPFDSPTEDAHNAKFIYDGMWLLGDRVFDLNTHVPPLQAWQAIGEIGCI